MPIGLVIVILIAILILTFSSYHQGNDKRKIEEFLKEESKTYIKPKTVLNNIEFINVDLSDIKFKAKSSEGKEAVKNLLAFQDLKIANFKNKSNTDLKKEFGSNNFDEVLDYQNNYDNLLNTIRTTSEYLINDEDDKSAIKILNLGIDLGDDVTKSYTMLADLYSKNKMRKEMYHLVDTVRTNKNLSQKKIMNYIAKLENVHDKGEK